MVFQVPVHLTREDPAGQGPGAHLAKALLHRAWRCENFALTESDAEPFENVGSGKQTRIQSAG